MRIPRNDFQPQGWAIFQELPVSMQVEAVYLSASGLELRAGFSLEYEGISQGEADKFAVNLIREQLAQQGYRLKALWDVSDDCFRRLLYRAGKR